MPLEFLAILDCRRRRYRYDFCRILSNWSWRRYTQCIGLPPTTSGINWKYHEPTAISHVPITEKNICGCHGKTITFHCRSLAYYTSFNPHGWSRYAHQNTWNTINVQRFHELRSSQSRNVYACVEYEQSITSGTPSFHERIETCEDRLDLTWCLSSSLLLLLVAVHVNLNVGLK